jgi:uncharacterized protein YndB with AHSA1/START domain
MSAHGTYERIEGKPAVRFTRRLRHPVERVWEAVTRPEELASWFPARVEGDLETGGRLRFRFDEDNPEGIDGTEGEVLVFERPRTFWFTWEGEELRFDLEPTADGGCVLSFVYLIPDEDEAAAARNTAGWHVCLDTLESLLAGGPASAPGGEPTDRWRELYDDYVARGVPHGAPIPGEAGQPR